MGVLLSRQGKVVKLRKRRKALQTPLRRLRKGRVGRSTDTTKVNPEKKYQKGGRGKRRPGKDSDSRSLGLNLRLCIRALAKVRSSKVHEEVHKAANDVEGVSDSDGRGQGKAVEGS